jgi:hypothetical protein
MAWGLPLAIRARASAICVICEICGLLFVSSMLVVDALIAGGESS